MNPSSLDSQRGAALVVSLVLLVAITLIGVFVMSSSHLEWLMSSNDRFQSDSELRAEYALVVGENKAKNIDATTYPWSNNDAYYNNLNPPDALPADPRDITKWDPAAFNTLNTTTISPAEYLIEYMGCSKPGTGSGCGAPCLVPDTVCIYTYRIWAHAVDSKGAGRIVQSTFTRAIRQPPIPPPGEPIGAIININTSVAFAQIDHDQPPSP